jgi:DNA-binding GntR family transcriptional regulator
LYAMRRLLESFAARAFTELATDEQVQALEATTQKLAAAALSGVGADVIGAKTEFYSVLLSGCGNSLVQETLGGLLTRVSLLRATSLLNAQRLPKSMKEIQALMVAIKSRDAASAERVSKRHLLNAERAAIEAFEKQLTIF